MKQENLDGWRIVLRFARICFALVLATVGMAIIGSALWSTDDGHILHRAATPLFALLFIGPGVLLVAFLLSFPLYLIDQTAHRMLGLRRLAFPWVGLAFGAGIGLGYLHWVPGVICIFLCIYWLLAGRVIGRSGWSFRRPWRSQLDEWVYLVFMIWLLAPAARFLLATLVFAVVPMHAGAPPFQVQYEHQMNPSVRWATWRFPDAQSCLRPGADAETRGDLLEMDWDRIRTSAEAQVCTFRLLHRWGGVAEAQTWLEAQGFRVPDIWSSTHPYEARDGTLRVDGGWPIDELGPRFPTRGPIRRVLASVPYAMSINATFSADGSTLLFVGYGFSTL